MDNQFGVDYSFPGLCSLCHKEIAEFEGSRQVKEGVFRPIIKRIMGFARTFDVVLDDESVMTVPLCKTCYGTIKPEDMQELMESEINGWQHEVDEVTSFPDEKKVTHMKKYSERFIVDRADKKWKNSDKDKIEKPRKSKLKVRTK